MVLAAGVAQADITWSGSATAGLARDGKVAAKATTITANDILTARLDILAVDTTTAASAGTTTGTDANITGDVAAAGTATVATLLVNIASAKANINLGTSNAAAGAATVADNAAAITELDRIAAYLGAGAAVDAVATGKMKQYSEVNATASASVATDMGWVVSAAISVDAGTGYDFADDDTFDAAKTNGVGLDSVSIDFGAGGKLTLDQDAVAHLVDADDDGAADLLYTNTFGTASFSFAADIDDGDSDALATAGGINRGNNDGTVGELTLTAAQAADVQWSTKVSMPLAGTNVYFAADEEGGDAYGVSGTYAGL
ncbi:hypothetical protein N8446_07635, partial [Planktomarina temperata]|nr:hypothetical protein [Planktomarina temperata]